MIHYAKIAQILLGLSFIFSSITKALEPKNTAVKISQYLHILKLNSLQRFSLLIAVLLNITEFLLGIALTLRIFLIPALIITTGFMVLFTPKTFYVALAKKMDLSGCFGSTLKFTPAQASAKNILLDILLIISWFNTSPNNLLDSKMKITAIFSALFFISLLQIVKLFQNL